MDACGILQLRTAVESTNAGEFVRKIPLRNLFSPEERKKMFGRINKTKISKTETKDEKETEELLKTTENNQNVPKNDDKNDIVISKVEENEKRTDKEQE